VYELLDYRHINEGDNSPLPPILVTFDRLSAESDNYGNVISNCTFSKYLGPGFRVGWQETVGSKLAAQLCSGGAVRSGGTPAQMNTMIAAELIKNGDIDKVIANVCAVLADRSKAMQENIVSYLPEGTIVEGGNGGYFLWVTLPDKYNVEEITQKCAQRNVILAPEKNFQVADKSLNFVKVKQHSFRVSISFHEKNEYIQGLKVWAQVCKEHVI
jgi:DNA-binding transcriptional MocR family regulator